MMITIALLTGVCLGYIARVFVERLNKPITSQSLDEMDAEWEQLKRRVDATFGKPKTDPKSRK
jgi:hypothetical protein